MIIEPFDRKSTYLIIFLILISFESISQIQGSVRDFNNRALSFANVLLLNNSDSTTIAGVMATEEGVFHFTEFEPGNYVIGIQMLGYKLTHSPTFEVKSANTHIHLDPIIVEEESYHIGDVDVVAKKPVFELKIDRMVVNVENSVTSSGNTALEVLEKSPGVIVDRQNYGISLSGKSGVIVMINGKENRMPLEAAIQMLDAMSADNVNKIELITTPPSKYDAEGNAGIINIVLKKNENFGTNGSFTLGGGVANKEKLNGSLNLNHHSDKVNYYGSYSASYDNKYQKVEMYRIQQIMGFKNESNTYSLRDPQLTFQNARLGLDYSLSSKTELGVLFEGRIRHWGKNDMNDSEYRSNNSITSISNVHATGYDKWSHAMGNINLHHHFREDELLDVNFDYLRYINQNPTYYKIKTASAGGEFESGEEIDIEKETPINFYVGKIDYSRQVNPKLKLESGIKSTFSDFINDVAVNHLNSGEWKVNEDMTNKNFLNENIIALYTSFNYKISDKTSIVGGLRYEYLNIVLNSAFEKGIVDLHYGKLFPTLYFSQAITKNNTLQLSYGRRIDRPTYNELAPFITFVSPEILFSGNENLLPAFSDLFKVDYQIKSVTISISHTNTKDAISRFQPVISEDTNQLLYTSKNFESSKTTSAMLAFPMEINDWWNMRFNLNLVFLRLKSDYEGENIDRNTNSHNLNTIQSFELNKRFSAELAAFYNSPSVDGVTNRKASGKVDIGIQMKFKNENSRLSFNVSDIFKTNTWHWTTDIPELNIYVSSFIDFEPRVARLTFTHNFGSTSIKSARKRSTGSEDERKRVNN